MKKKTDQPSACGDPLEPGKFYILNSQYDEAQRFFEERMASDENNPEIHYHLGLIAEATHDTDRARECYERVLSIQPKHRLARKHLNVLLGLEKP